MEAIFTECTEKEFNLLIQDKLHGYTMELVEDLDQVVTYYYDNKLCTKPFAKVLSYELWDDVQSYGWKTKYYTVV